MAEGPGELGLLLHVAAVTQVGLLFHQQEVHVSRLMRVVAVGAGNAVGQVFGLGEVLRLQAGLMALQTDGGGLRRAEGFEADDLGDIAAAVDVRLGGTVTGLAAVLAILQQGRVWCVVEVLVPHLLVAGLADIVGRVLAIR